MPLIALNSSQTVEIAILTFELGTLSSGGWHLFLNRAVSAAHALSYSHRVVKVWSQTRTWVRSVLVLQIQWFVVARLYSGELGCRFTNWLAILIICNKLGIVVPRVSIKLNRFVEEVLSSTMVHHLVSLADLAPLWPLDWINFLSPLTIELSQLGCCFAARIWAKSAFYCLFKRRLSFLSLSSLFFLNEPCLTALVHRLVENFRITQAHFWGLAICLVCRWRLWCWLLRRLNLTCPVLLQTSSNVNVLSGLVLFKSLIICVSLLVACTWFDSCWTQIAGRRLSEALRYYRLLKLSSYFVEQVLIKRLLVDLGCVCRVIRDVHGEVLINGQHSS